MAFEVGSALEAAGVVAVLCGGSAATFYAGEVYQSADLDFVLRFGESARTVTEALHEIGFRREAAYFAHPLTPYTLDFPPGPLAVGGRIIESYDIVRARGRVLRVITPNDCVCDRLTANAAWADVTALQAAVSVCRYQAARIDLTTIRAFMAGEDGRAYAGAFEQTMRQFERRLTELPNIREIRARKARKAIAGSEMPFVP